MRLTSNLNDDAAQRIPHPSCFPATNLLPCVPNPMRTQAIALALTLGTAAFAAAPSTNAFCGFYVAGADQ